MVALLAKPRPAMINSLAQGAACTADAPASTAASAVLAVSCADTTP